MNTETTTRPPAANPFEARQSTVFVLGIVSLFFGLLAPVAWILGNKLRKEAATAGYPEPGNAKIGRIIGMIVSIMLAGLLALMFVLVLIPVIL